MKTGTRSLFAAVCALLAEIGCLQAAPAPQMFGTFNGRDYIYSATNVQALVQEASAQSAALATNVGASALQSSKVYANELVRTNTLAQDARMQASLAAVNQNVRVLSNNVDILGASVASVQTQTIASVSGLVAAHNADPSAHSFYLATRTYVDNAIAAVLVPPESAAAAYVAATNAEAVAYTAIAAASNRTDFSNMPTAVWKGTNTLSVGNGSLASAPGSAAFGIGAIASNFYAFVWNGIQSVFYGDRGPGTFNVNPIGGPSGFFIGSNSLASVVDAAIEPYKRPSILYNTYANVGNQAYMENPWTLRVVESVQYDTVVGFPLWATNFSAAVNGAGDPISVGPVDFNPELPEMRYNEGFVEDIPGVGLKLTIAVAVNGVYSYAEAVGTLPSVDYGPANLLFTNSVARGQNDVFSFRADVQTASTAVREFDLRLPGQTAAAVQTLSNIVAQITAEGVVSTGGVARIAGGILDTNRVYKLWGTTNSSWLVLDPDKGLAVYSVTESVHHTWRAAIGGNYSDPFEAPRPVYEGWAASAVVNGTNLSFSADYYDLGIERMYIDYIPGAEFAYDATTGWSGSTFTFSGTHENAYLVYDGPTYTYVTNSCFWSCLALQALASTQAVHAASIAGLAATQVVHTAQIAGVSNLAQAALERPVGVSSSFVFAAVAPVAAISTNAYDAATNARSLALDALARPVGVSTAFVESAVAPVAVLATNAYDLAGTAVRTNASHSIQIGVESFALANYSFAYGYLVTASGVGSRAFGYDSLASGHYSVAEGSGCTASGTGSMAFGQMTTASAGFATAFGRATVASGVYSLAIGSQAIASDFCSFVWNGYGEEPPDYYSHGDSTFNINPLGGPSGFYIGETNLQTYLDEKVNIDSGTATNLSVFSSLNLLGKQVTWNTDKATFDIPLDNGVVLQLGQEQHLWVRNQTGSTLGNGKIVCSDGAVGDNASVRLASQTDAGCAWGVLGMVTQDAGIDHGSNGYITTMGEVNDLALPTDVYQASNTLWLATDGNYTNVEPVGVAAKYKIGTVLRAHASQGRILFKAEYVPSAADVGAASVAQLGGKVDTVSGYATNLTVSGLFVATNTPFTPYPVTPSVWRSLITSPSVVTVNQDRAVYRVTVATPNSISNVLSGLTFDGTRTATWELWVNYTSTNALSTQWDARMDWGGLTPELTVTGQYKFACSTVDGIAIQAQQVYPTNGRRIFYPAYGGAIASMPAATNGTQQAILCQPLNTLCYARVYVRSSVSITNNYAVFAPAYSKYGQDSASIIKQFTLTGTYVMVPFVDQFTTTDFMYNRNANLYYWGVMKIDPTDVSTPHIFGDIRPANELEIKAYNQGWRP